MVLVVLSLFISGVVVFGILMMMVVGLFKVWVVVINLVLIFFNVFLVCLMSISILVMGYIVFVFGRCVCFR